MGDFFYICTMDLEALIEVRKDRVLKIKRELNLAQTELESVLKLKYTKDTGIEVGSKVQVFEKMGGINPGLKEKGFVKVTGLKVTRYDRVEVAGFWLKKNGAVGKRSYLHQSWYELKLIDKKYEEV